MIGLIKGLPRKVNMAGSPQPIVTFTSNVSGLYIPEILAYIQATQSGSGDPSPINPRTINGVSSVDTTRTGKNLLPVTLTSGTDTGIEYTVNADGTIKAYGRSTALRNVNIGSMTLPAGAYFLNGCVGGATDTYRLQALKGNTNLGLDTGSGVEFTLTEPTTVVVRIQIRANNLDVDTTFSPMVIIGSTDTAYHAYTGQTATTALGGTYYGGYVNVTTGLLTVTHKSATLDETTANDWSHTTQGTLERWQYTGISDIKDIGGSSKASILCDRLKSITTGEENGISQYQNRVWVYVDSSISDVTAWTNWLTANPLNIVYELATPQTIQLTPAQIEQILGQNNVFCSSGDVAVTQIWARRDRSIISRG